MHYRLLIILLLFYTNTCLSSDRLEINPISSGIKKAKNDIERYYILLHCHQKAVLNNAAISYKGIDTLRIEIPKDFKTIPLTDNVDFGGVTLIVKNQVKDCYLYTMTAPLAEVKISGEEIDKGDFKNNRVLRSGVSLLVVEDGEPWCERRGYVSKVIRKDAMVVRNGVSTNLPVLSYSSEVSKPIGQYRSIGLQNKLIKNLNFVRTNSSTYITNCIKIENQYNIDISNITITTPCDSIKYGDKAIHIENSVDVNLNDIHIYGTYSQKRQYGYGISLMNIYDLKVNRMFARSNWGVFGTHCINKVRLKDCDINRFDIHCYGKDVKAIGCSFSHLYNQFSSIYGTIVFDKCTFEDFVPVLIESSYNAYTPFNLIWKNCTFYLDAKHNFLMTLFGVPNGYNNRPELHRKSLPNITISNCKVILDDAVNEWYLVQTGGVKYPNSFDGISEITIRGLKVENEGSRVFKLFSEEVKATNPVNIRISGRQRQVVKNLNQTEE